MRKGSPDSSSSARGEAGVPGEHCRPGTEPVLQGAWGLPPAVRHTDALVTGTKSPGKASQGRTAERMGSVRFGEHRARGAVEAAAGG